MSSFAAKLNIKQCDKLARKAKNISDRICKLNNRLIKITTKHAQLVHPKASSQKHHKGNAWWIDSASDSPYVDDDIIEEEEDIIEEEEDGEFVPEEEEEDIDDEFEGCNFDCDEEEDDADKEEEDEEHNEEKDEETTVDAESAPNAVIVNVNDKDVHGSVVITSADIDNDKYKRLCDDIHCLKCEMGRVKEAITSLIDDVEHVKDKYHYFRRSNDGGRCNLWRSRWSDRFDCE